MYRLYGAYRDPVWVGVRMGEGSIGDREQSSIPINLFVQLIPRNRFALISYEPCLKDRRCPVPSATHITQRWDGWRTHKNTVNTQSPKYVQNIFHFLSFPVDRPCSPTVPGRLNFIAPQCLWLILVCDIAPVPPGRIGSKV